MARQYKLISADGHIDLNPDVWNQRVSPKFRDRAPKRVTMPSGSDAVVVDGGKPNTIGITRSVNTSHENMAQQVPTFATGAGTGTPEQRCREQDQDGVEAEILFSQIYGVFRQAQDDDLYRELFRAYNEFLGEEYQAHNPERLLPMGVIPSTGVDDAIRELEHCKQLGLRGISLPKFPSGKGYPTPEDDKFWAAAVESGLTIANHTAGRFGNSREPMFTYSKKPGEDVHQQEPMNYFFRFTSDSMQATTQMAFAGVWDRFPTLEIYWAETMIGWLEFGLWQIDDHYDRYMNMIHENWGLSLLERKPSEYLKANNYWGFLYDPVGVKRRECVGYDKILWASDFAHAASDWPHSLKTIEQAFVGVPEDEKHAILAGNAVRLFHLDQ